MTKKTPLTLDSRKIFIAAAAVAAGLQFFSFLSSFRSSLERIKSETPPLPGYEFADFKEKLAFQSRVGFLTNKDMSPEKNDGNFLAVQYLLAPVILELDCLKNRFSIIDSTSWFSAYVKVKEAGLTPIYKNDFGKVLAEKRP